MVSEMLYVRQTHVKIFIHAGYCMPYKVKTSETWKIAKNIAKILEK